MNFKIRLSKIEKIVMALLILISIFVGVRPISGMAVQAVSNIVGRKADAAWWSYELKIHLFAPTCVAIVLYADYLLLKYWKNKVIYPVNLVFFFIMSNFAIWNKGDFQGYSGTWDNADLGSFLWSGDCSYSNIYSSNYPPIANIILRWLTHYCLKSDGAVSEYAVTYVINIFMLAMVLALFILFGKMLKPSIKYKNLFTASLFVSSSMLFAIQRMNIMLLALAFCLVFILLYENENNYLVVLGLFCLAISANVKLFPAAYGLLLIKRKKWKESIICFLMAIVLLTIPLVVTRNSDNCEKIITNNVVEETSESHESAIDNVMVDTSVSRLKEMFNSIGAFADIDRTIGKTLSTHSIVYKLLSWTGLPYNIIKMLGFVVLMINVVILIGAFFVTKRKDIELIALSILCVSVVSTSCWYFTIFFIPAFIEFVNRDDYSYENNILGIAWILLLSFQWGFANGFYLQNCLIILPIWICMMIIVIKERAAWKKKD